MKNNKGLIIAISIAAVVFCLSCCCCSSVFFSRNKNEKNKNVSEITENGTESAVTASELTTEELTNGESTVEATTEDVKIILQSTVTGEYGRKLTLNANTDMPVDKYLYKVPAGKYSATTTFEKMASFYIVKDEIALTGSSEYPEEFQIVSDVYMLTAGDNDFNGTAKKEIVFEIAEDENIVIPGDNSDVYLILQSVKE